MPVLRRVARPFLASIFVVGGIDALRNSKSKVGAAEPVVAKIAGMLPDSVPTDVETLVRVDAAVKVGAGALLALNRFPRLSAFALAGSLVPTTIAGHRFWEEKDPPARAMQRIHFFKNLSMLGGLLIATADTEGRPSLGWRARRAAGSAGGWVTDTAQSTTDRASGAVGSVRDSLPVG